MNKMRVSTISKGVYVVELLDIHFQVVCGCPADCIKSLAKRGVVKKIDDQWESGPNAILLSELPIQNGQLTNLTEFPILHMLYKQGLLIPGHPGNTGAKPIIIGTESEIKAQLNYLYRGNYGLVSKEELMATGMDETTAAEMYAIKKHFAFGNISRPDNLVDTYPLDQGPATLPNKLKVERTAVNVFKFSYKGDTATIDLNLKTNERYEPAVFLSKTNIDPGYFSVIHSGDGDGWDVNRSCMGSIISYDSDYYLVDAGPNIHTNLEALGISLHDIRGIFMTHCHDDHFAGLFNLFMSPIRLNFYATPWVRQTVSKKICALLNFDYDQLNCFFNIRDLESNSWNDIDGLEVKPFYSPHPVDTTCYTFRVLWEGGYRSYTHLADISSFSIVDQMVNKKVITSDRGEEIKQNYLQPSQLKKIDTGGGMIHGSSEDFREDPSLKKILSHKSIKLSNEERQIGSSAPFGCVDVLIQGRTLFDKKIYESFKLYFPTMDSNYFKKARHCDIKKINAETIITRDDENIDYVYLILKGNVERIDSDYRHQVVLSGAVIGDLGLLGFEKQFTYRSLSYAEVLKIPTEIYIKTLYQFELIQYLKTIYTKLLMMSDTKIFEHIAPTIHFKDIIASMSEYTLEKGINIYDFAKENHMDQHLFVIVDGKVVSDDIVRGSGDFCLEELIITDTQKSKPITIEKSKGFLIEKRLVRRIPFLYWKVFEVYSRHLHKKTA